MCASFKSIKNFSVYMRAGDWLILLISAAAVIYLFQSLWSNSHATKVQIRIGDHVHATYDLHLSREVQVHGAMGNAVIQIADGKARFAKSPCSNEYCVHQGWLSRNGQTAICLPNQISLELLGEKRPFDTLNY